MVVLDDPGFVFVTPHMQLRTLHVYFVSSEVVKAESKL